MSERNRKDRSYRLIDETIRATYLRIIETEHRIPSQKEVAEACGVTDRTIRNHLNRIQLGTQSLPFRIFTNDVFLGLLERAKTGDPSAVKLYFMLVFNWHDRVESEVLDESNESQLAEWLRHGREILRALKHERIEENSD